MQKPQILLIVLSAVLHSVRNATLGRKNAQITNLQAVGLQPFVAGRIPDGMQVARVDTVFYRTIFPTGMGLHFET
ncbi:MAG: hypothetical protein FWH23_01340 [Bacteroidales bacterium]|nr:hypothetical protein [Bacteroidales bacterium]